MAATAARVIQVVKPHMRLIKFPNRHAPNTQATMPEVPASLAAASIPPPSAPATPVSQSKPVGSIPRGTGISDTQLPERYKRKLLSDEEIEYILRGGPE